MECFLKPTETKEWSQQNMTLLRARENNGGKSVYLHYLDLPIPQEKKQNPLRKRHKLKQSVVRTGAALMREEKEERERRWEESYRRDSWEKINAEVPSESERKKKREENKVQSGKGRGKKSRRDDTSQCHPKDCCA